MGERFLNSNNMKLLLRAHEMQENGVGKQHEGKVYTVFSAPNYCDIDNLGAVMIIRSKDNHSFALFQHGL